MSGTTFSRFTGYRDLEHRKHEIVADRFDTTRITRRAATPSTELPKAEEFVQAAIKRLRT